MNTPLIEITLNSGILKLSAEVLGNRSYNMVAKGFKNKSDIELTNCSFVKPATANLLIIKGSLENYLGIENVPVRLYLFEVVDIQGYRNREAIFLFTDMPTTITANGLAQKFCGTTSTNTIVNELSLLSTLSFSEPTLLFSTLNYQSSVYLDPPFPPSEDKDIAEPFIASVKEFVTGGYIFKAKANLAVSVTFPLSPDAPPDEDPFVLDTQTILTILGLGDLCSDSPFNLIGQIDLSNYGATLNLLHKLDSSVLPDKIPLHPSITDIGIGIPLGSGTVQIPILELDGTISLSQKPTRVRMAFDLYTYRLSVDFSDIPDFKELEEAFGNGVIKSTLGSFLPDGVMHDLGELVLQSLSLSIDCQGFNVPALSFAITTEHPLVLFKGIEVQPAFIAKYDYPFKSFRTYDVDVVGKWYFKSTELDIIFHYEKGVTSDDNQASIMAQLAIGSSINLIDLAAQIFHVKVAGLPSLVLADVDVTALQKGSGDTQSKSINVAIDVAAGWNLEGVDLEIENLNLVIDFAKESPKSKWKLEDVMAQGTLEIGPVFFNLEANYYAADEYWYFAGGSTPDEQLNLGDFLTAVTKDLGLAPPGDFLEPLHHVEVTGCYLEHETSSSGSSTWKMNISTDFVSGGDFNQITLDSIILRFDRDGNGTAFAFDATAPEAANQGIEAVTNYLSDKLGINVHLPAALTGSDIQLKGLSASYNATTKNYNFVAYLDFAHDAMIQLHINVWSHTLNGKTSKDYDLGGTLIFNPGKDNEFIFMLDMVKSDGISDLVASFESNKASKGLKLSELIHAINPDAPGLGDFEIEIKNALFAHSGKIEQTPAKSLFAVDMGAQVNLSKLGNLPLIGADLKDVSSLDLAFQVVYATGAYTDEELQLINKLLGNPSFRFPENAIGKDAKSIATSIRLGGEQVVDLTVPVGANDDGSLKPTGDHISSKDSQTSTTGSGTDDPQVSTTNDDTQTVTWFPLNKGFGPMHMNRVGLSFNKSVMGVTGYLDGSVGVGPLNLDLLGLDVTVPLIGDQRFEPSFGLHGLGLDYQNGPLMVAGALMKTSTGGTNEFNGFITVSSESLAIGAVGSFAEMKDGHKSLFVYAVQGEPIGGPAFFFVTGMAGGLGYNRKLIPPDISQVQKFPLITEAMAPSPPPQTGDINGIKDYVSNQLQKMQSNIVPSVGEYFLALGIKFTSFELIDGFLLANVSLGHEFRLDLIGLANAIFPPDDKNEPLAEVQLAVLAHYIPSEGSIWVQGQLTPNSYILSRNCHLTGGFALAAWVDGSHEGEFVVSVGGYATNYQIPSYYPQPARVGFNWQVSPHLNIKGGGYFALLPHALMAGGSFNAVWQTKNVKAWFLMNCDFLMEWKPFHYTANLHVDLGAELTIHHFGTHHKSIDAAADLEVWGPEFGGRARITVHVIGIKFHINIDFGSAMVTPSPLIWNEFQTSFLPAEKNHWAGINIQKGLLQTVKSTLDNNSEVDIWLVKRDELQLGTTSIFPVKSVAFNLNGNAATIPDIESTNFGIAPMDVASVDTSKHTITITNLSEKGNSSNGDHFKLISNSQKIPSAMWGSSRKQPLNPAPGESLVDAVSGFAIVPTQKSTDDPEAITKDRASMSYETTQQKGFQWATDTGTFQTVSSSSLWSKVNDAIKDAQSKRSSALSKMGFQDFKENFNVPLNRNAPNPPKLGTMKS